MFIGHFAPAFAAAALSNRSPKLGTLFVAAQLVDWGFFSLALIGVEKMRVEPGATAMVPFDLYHMPYTHSLLGSAAWAVGFALIVALWQRNAVGGIIAGLVVMSHWLLDWLTHAPDLTLAGSPPAYGLGLWDRPLVAMPLEVGITLGAFFLYLARTRGPAGQPIVLLVAMLGLQGVNWFAPHPAEAGPFLYLQALIAFAVLTALAWWVGENRQRTRRGGLAVRPA
jgi:predicted outer membrane lipoprotein